MYACPICDSTSVDLIFKSSSELSLTSLCEFRSGKVHVWQCRECGHLFGNELEDTKRYYESDYRILLNHEDEDQIYEVKNGRVVYRTEHQLQVLGKNCPLKPGMRILDYGCAKAAMPKRMLSVEPRLEMHLFDVSSMYQKYWTEFLPEGRYAVDMVPEAWISRFDVVTSFFALEHIPRPFDTVCRIRDLINADGCFYGIVPDTIGNYADFVVIDHVNHFTERSLFTLLRRAGFGEIRIDRDSHRGALVFIAKRGESTTAPPLLDLEPPRNVSAFWVSIGEYIQAAEASHPEKRSSIYGSGFYGAYIASLLQRPADLHCFLDASPFRQGRSLMDKPILAPSELPESVELIYIGLNPSIARRTVAEMDWMANRSTSIVYLDGDIS
jgi:hypothetical protein